MIFQVLTVVSMKIIAFWDIYDGGTSEMRPTTNRLHGTVSQKAIILI
jgi:hypothetical protein